MLAFLTCSVVNFSAIPNPVPLLLLIWLCAPQALFALLPGELMEIFLALVNNMKGT
jgi:hypothetical protein